MSNENFFECVSFVTWQHAWLIYFIFKISMTYGCDFFVVEWKSMFSKLIITLTKIKLETSKIYWQRIRTSKFSNEVCISKIKFLRELISKRNRRTFIKCELAPNALLWLFSAFNLDAAIENEKFRKEGFP